MINGFTRYEILKISAIVGFVGVSMFHSIYDIQFNKSFLDLEYSNEKENKSHLTTILG
jgi:hypothetical protein